MLVSFHAALLSTDTALKKFEALHCALAREFVLPLKSPREVRDLPSRLLIASYLTQPLSLSWQLFSEALQSLLDRGVLQCHEQGWAVLNGYLEETFVFLRNLILPFVAGIWVRSLHHYHAIACSGTCQWASLFRLSMSAPSLFCRWCASTSYHLLGECGR